jgi:hypothetical protein
MRTTRLTRLLSSQGKRIAGVLTAGLAVFLIAIVLRAGPGDPELKVLKTGLGIGTVTSDDGRINCGTVCDTDYASPVDVELTAVITPSQAQALLGGASRAAQAPVRVA